MIVHLNGWPGTGKLTVARELSKLLGSKLLDNHTLHNIPGALCDRGSDTYWKLYQQVRDVTYHHLLTLPPDTIIVMTNALLRESNREIESWEAVKRLAQHRGDKLVSILLTCSLEENIARIQQKDRAWWKMTDPAPLIAWRSQYHLLSDGADQTFHLDNTSFSPQAAAGEILTFLAKNDVIPNSTRA